MCTNHTKVSKDQPDHICVTTSVFNVSMKEIYILSLFLALLVYSVVAFLKHWNKNYRNVNYLPHFTEGEIEKENSKKSF